MTPETPGTPPWPAVASSHRLLAEIVVRLSRVMLYDASHTRRTTMLACVSPMSLSVRAVVVSLLLALLGSTGVQHAAAGNEPGTSHAAPTNEVTMEENQPTASGALDTRLAAAHTQFGFKLYAELVRQ